jgi:hypothetical protein
MVAKRGASDRELRERDGTLTITSISNISTLCRSDEIIYVRVGTGGHEVSGGKAEMHQHLIIKHDECEHILTSNPSEFT